MTTYSPIASSNTLLEVKNLSVDYYASNGTVHALTDVSITLDRGQILGLAGESGSGKSTLAYAITRLLRPPAAITAGQLLYHRRGGDDMEKGSLRSPVADTPHTVDVLQFTSAQLRAFRWNELSIVFQSAMNALNPVLNIGAQIDDVLRTHRPTMGPDSRRRRAIELLRLVGIAPDRIRSYPHELSGGMRQRAIIAIALALSPELIIMDEPTTALDVVVQREILLEIMELRERLNFSVIFITHDLSLLLEIADKIAIMYAGRIVETASSRELRRKPHHPYSYGLLNSFPTLHGPRRKMTGIPGSPPDLRAIPSGCAFHPRCPFAFEACNAILPTLKPSVPFAPLARKQGATGQGDSAPLDLQQSVETGSLVACHLYDARLNPAEPPSTADFAAKFAATYEPIQGARKAE